MTAERRRYWRPDMSFLVYPRNIVRHSVVRAVLAGVLIGAAMLGVQIAMDSLTGPTERTLLLSDMFVGVITAIVTGAGLRQYDAHLRADEARMRMIAEMNHHVRNALTAISLSVYAKNDPHLEQITRESIQRIDWALREVLPHPENVREMPQPENEEAQRRSA